ncbi:MAG: hypothetical protein WA322_27250 [Pseudolabrys sp.]
MLPSKASPKIFAVSPWPGIAVHYVDAVIKRAGRASSVVRKPAQDASWGGYSGYFSDIDGHLWEVAYNPHFPLSDDGRSCRTKAALSSDRSQLLSFAVDLKRLPRTHRGNGQKNKAKPASVAQ